MSEFRASGGRDRPGPDQSERGGGGLRPPTGEAAGGASDRPGGPERPPSLNDRFVVFRAGGERFALPLGAVREVVLPKPPFARVPRSSAAVRGAMNLRGRVVPVVDLAALVGLDAARLGDAEGQVVVLESPRPALGLHIAGVVGVEPLALDAADPAGARRLVATRGGPATVLDAAALAAAAAAHFGGSP